jgi:choline dehydrogenase
MGAHGIAAVQELPGVGRGLQDHPATRIVLAGTPELREAMDRFVAGGGMPREEGTIALERSSRCREGFDLHLYPLGSRARDGNWLFAIYAAVMKLRSRGSVRIGGRDPEALPVIDTGYFSDEGGEDLAVLVEGLEQARALAAAEPLASLAGPEIEPCLSLGELPDYVCTHGLHDYHPTSTCRMGPASDADAVVDASGRVHGLEGLYAADAAIMPTVPRANTNLPAAAVAEKIAEGLIGRV